uniref:Uncharacterized protein n=1 Tax=Cacopsylla melanoneura TaxID=428564 RepID=A0A8D9BM06_9HEMI
MASLVATFLSCFFLGTLVLCSAKIDKDWSPINMDTDKYVSQFKGKDLCAKGHSDTICMNDMYETMLKRWTNAAIYYTVRTCCEVDSTLPGSPTVCWIRRKESCKMFSSRTTWECQCYREGNETKCRDRAAY